MDRKTYNCIIKKRDNKTKNIKPKITPTPAEICFDQLITACYQITEEQCLCLNYERQQQRTIYKTIEVGLQLPNQNGQLIRFIPRYITFPVKYVEA